MGVGGEDLDLPAPTGLYSTPSRQPRRRYWRRGSVAVDVAYTVAQVEFPGRRDQIGEALSS